MTKIFFCLLCLSSSLSVFGKACSNYLTVAVIDTGVDPRTNLRTKLWKKEKTRAVYGWDFVLNRPNPFDDHGHGTHVSGLISKVASCVKLMPLKYYSPKDENFTIERSVKAINYAIDNGAKIINYSGGGKEFSYEELKALKKAQQKGIIVVAAAGNEKLNIDGKEKYYPAAYGLNNIISVAAVTPDDNLIPESNWGRKTVDVATLGFEVPSLLPGGKEGVMTGTSQATALVSGYIANLLLENPELTLEQIREVLNNKSRKIPSLLSKIKSGGVLDIIETKKNNHGRNLKNLANGKI